MLLQRRQILSPAAMLGDSQPPRTPSLGGANTSGFSVHIPMHGCIYDQKSKNSNIIKYYKVIIPLLSYMLRGYEQNTISIYEQCDKETLFRVLTKINICQKYLRTFI